MRRRGSGHPRRDGARPLGRSPSRRVDVQQHVLAGRERLAAATVEQRVEQVEPLLVGCEHLRLHGERLERRDLAQIADMTLDGIGAVATLEVRVVDADVAAGTHQSRNRNTSP